MWLKPLPYPVVFVPSAKADGNEFSHFISCAFVQSAKADGSELRNEFPQPDLTFSFNWNLSFSQANGNAYQKQSSVSIAIAVGFSQRNNEWQYFVGL